MSFVVKAVSSVVKAVVKVVGSVVKAVFNVVADVINFVASPFLALLGIKMPNAAQEADRQQGVLIQRNGGGANPIPVVYGYRRVGGIVTFCETGSNNNKYLWVAYTFAEGRVEGINEVFIDDNQLSVETVRRLNSGQVVTVPDAKYKNRVVLQWFPGTYFPDPSQSPVGTGSILQEAPSWRTTNAFNGMATLFARFEWIEAKTQDEADANPFSGSIPNVQVSLLGKRVSSLRTGAGTENTEYYAAGYQERYSTNPAECLLDYLRNPRYGKGLKNSDIDWASFYTAAQKCNQEIAYTSTVRGPILTLNYVVDTNQTLFNNVRTMLQNFRGYLPYVQGKYKLKIEDAGNPTDIMSGAADIAAIFDRDSIVGDISFTGVDRSSKVNQVVVTYVDPDQKFSNQEVVYPPTEAERQVYINYDGGRENKADLTFGGITNQQIARDMARLAFFKSRFQETCSLKVNAQGFTLEPGDNIFIRSNILNFESSPWRVVSIKLLNDYTFDLGCVRNPDFIYPYVTPNTPDRVIAPYIPKGASILQPLSGGGSLVGLTPPVTAPVWNGENPGTTTGGATGGGVGSGTGAINVSGGSPPTVPPVLNILKDFVTIDSANYAFPSAGVGTADITFIQPGNPMYESLQFYYKLNSSAETVWNLVEINTKSGAGQPISFKIGPVPLPNASSTTYDVRTRVKYSTGEYSTVVGRTQLIFDPTVTTGNPVDFQETVGTGWSLATSGVSARNDYAGYVVGTTVLTAGAPSTPRTLDITVQQDISARPINSDISGVKLYYKPSAATYWSERLLPFSNYVAGTRATVRLADLGVPGSAQNYDIIIRFAYRDNSESTYQVRYMGLPTETSLSLNLFDPFYTVQKITETVSSYPFMTVDQGVASGAIADVRNMRIGIAANFTASNPSLTTHLVPPDPSVAGSWIGVRVYTRQVVAGQNTALTSTDYRGMNVGSVGSVATRFFTQGVQYDVEYQYLIVPLVWYNGTTVEGNFSWIGQASVHFTQTRANYPANGNWISAFRWTQGETSLLKGQASTTFAQTEPTVIYDSWRLVNNNTAGLGEPVISGGVNFVSWNYQIRFSVAHLGADFARVNIYRRDSGPITNVNNLYGLGRWEKLTFDTSYSGYSAGTFTINLRLPTSPQEFSTTAVPPASIYTGWYPNAPTAVLIKEKPTAADEFWIVVETVSGGVSTRAIRLQGYPIQGLQGTASVDLRTIQGPQLPQAWTPSNFEIGSAALMRNLSSARTGTVNTSPVVAPNLYIYRNTPANYQAGIV